MVTEMALAEHLDRCCWRYVKFPSYRRKLESELPGNEKKKQRKVA